MGGTSFDEEGKQMILSRLNKAAARQAKIMFHNYICGKTNSSFCV